MCKEINVKHVKHWPNRGKLPAAKLSVKYAILHRIGTANWVPTNHTSTISIGLGRFIYVIGTRRAFDFRKYIFEQVVKQAFSTTAITNDNYMLSVVKLSWMIENEMK